MNLLFSTFLALFGVAGCVGPHSEEPTPVHSSNVPAEAPARWPVTIGCDPVIPELVCARFLDAATQDQQHFIRSGVGQSPDVRVGLSGERRVGTWTLALAAPFFTLDSNSSLASVRSAWSGEAGGKISGHGLQVDSELVSLLTALWGAPAASVQAGDVAQLLEASFEKDAWTLVSFDQLHPHWKVLEIDGQSPMRRNLDPSYGLHFALNAVSDDRADALAYLPTDWSNRDESQMTIVALTGVTAITRGMSRLIERKGVDYPAKDVADLLSSADFTHISNEVSFLSDCPRPHPRKTMRFCSHDSYIKVLEQVGADIIELTGNHNNDYGTDAFLRTLKMYEERGWKWFGGGKDRESSKKPATIEHGPHRLAFLGCNAVGGSAISKEKKPGARPCVERADFEDLLADVRRLRSEGWLPIVTVQYWEKYQYFPMKRQRSQFEELADAGAVVVSGSQAHQPQGFGLRGASFIHYGPGNLFFDQMQTLGTRQEFVDMLVFYGGDLLGVDVHALLLEEYGKPRPANTQETHRLLRSVFKYSHRKSGLVPEDRD